LDQSRLARVITLFEQALAVPRARRTEFVREVSGDDVALRQELGSLVEAHESASGYFDDLADHVASAAYAVVVERAPGGQRWEGRRIGAYRLVHEVGRGGMSRVFLAERADGQFEQRVALKLLRPGFDSDVDVMRLRAERQILASLSHPNIARLLDGGVTDDGLPYLVLEYVDGVAVDRYCESRALSTRQRLEIFLTIADAVEYAHHHAVVHRDLKPSNILVASDGTVKLLDFGVAKLLDQSAPGARPTTQTGYRWMTPEYAAPEQILGAPVTPRTDVYQLGVVLYQLLAGRTPFGRRVATLYELETAVLGEDPDSLGGILRGDLDAIVFRALRKAPAERYASVSECADDVRRHLTGHPVRARRQTLGYRTRRFVLRNRMRLAVAAVVLLLTATSATAVRVERARTRRALAAGRLGVGTVDSIARFVDQLVAMSAPGVALMDTTTARRLLERTPGHARALASQPERRAQVLEAAGRVHAKLRQYDAAISLMQSALVIRRRLGETRRAGVDTSGSSTGSPVTSGTAADPTRRKLLFVRPPGTVFMVDEDGTHEVRVTDPAEMMSAPAWAPDGRRVLLSRFSGARGIYVIDPDGTGLTQVTAPPPGWEDHMPSALGNQVVFTRTDSSHTRNRVYRVNLDGTGLTVLSVGAGAAAPSVQGDFVVFGREGDIYRLDLRGGAVTRLTTSPKQYKGVGAVSPDGHRILFTRIDPGRREQIFVMNADGTGTRRVSRGDYYDFLPRWSPDGTRIAFTSARDGTNGVYTMRADGTDVRDVSRTPQTLAMRPGVTVLDVNESLWAWMKY
jgi:tRNA A-37 threonylcarbamoyl transferase component Bud32